MSQYEQYDSLERRQRENARNAPLLRRSFNRSKRNYRMDFSPLRDEERDQAEARESNKKSRTEGRRQRGNLRAPRRTHLSPEEQANENVRNARRVILSGTRAKKTMYKRNLLRSIDFNQDSSSDLSGSEDEGRQTTPRSHGRRSLSPGSRSPSPVRNSRRTRRGSDSSARSEDDSRSRSPSSYRSRVAAARRSRFNGGRRLSLNHLEPAGRNLETPKRPSLSPSSSSRHRRSPALHNIDFAVNYDSSDSESEVSLRSPVKHRRNTAFFDVSSLGVTYDSDEESNNEVVEDEDWRSHSRLRGLRA